MHFVAAQGPRRYGDALYAEHILKNELGVEGTVSVNQRPDRLGLDSNGGNVGVHPVFMQPKKNSRISLAVINIYMNSYKNFKDTAKTDGWLISNGINPNQLTVGTPELLQAQKLATKSLRDHSRLLDQDQIVVLQRFLKMAIGPKRKRITQGECYRVLNITKKVQRLYAKSTKRM